MASAVRYDVTALRRRHVVALVVQSSKSTAVPSTSEDVNAALLLDDVISAVHFDVAVPTLTGMIETGDGVVADDAGTVCGRRALDRFFDGGYIYI